MRHLLRRMVPLLLMGSLLLPSTAAWAQGGDLELKPEDFVISDTTVIHLQAVKLYATILNHSNQDLLGSVQFKNLTTGNSIGSDQPISAVAEKTDTVFVDWRPSAGTYTLKATLIPWNTTGDNPDNNTAQFTLTVDYDYDNDGIGNNADPDDDNDGVPDTEDVFSLDETESVDTDGDNIGNNTDPDDDNDGTPDEEDDLPLDPTDTRDTDQDGTGDLTDDDDDNDGLTDAFEISNINPETDESKAPTDPLNPDTDQDGVNDKEDAFPLDAKEWEDTDNDNIGNNADFDDDGDELSDDEDEFPLNHGPVIVVERTEEVDAETEERTIIWDAGKSYDPDGELVAYRWFGRDGRLIGEKAILKLKIGELNTFLPTSLLVIDNIGESRTKWLKLSTLGRSGPLIIGLSLLLLLVLALMLYLKYTAGASKKDKPVEQTKKPRKR